MRRSVKSLGHAPSRWVILAMLLAGCHQAPWLTAAKRGGLSELKRAVDQGRQRDAFDREAARNLAYHVLEREIQSATDPDGEALLAQLAPCAVPLKQALSRRAERNDETAGVALHVLLASGAHLADSEWAEAACSPSPARRAAAAADSRDRTRWHLRERLLNDPNQDVRRAALDSYVASPSEANGDQLVNILQRDPDPQCRAMAARALGVVGGSEASAVLWDAWARAEPPLRLAIVSAWAQQRTFVAGGRERLIAIARSEPTMAGLLAAADLAEGASAGRPYGQARITRSLEFGSTEEKAFAVNIASWAIPEQAELLIRLGLQSEPLVRVGALGRWLERPTHRWPALTWLQAFAEEQDAAAIGARSVLAQHGEAVAVAGLRHQLGYAKAVSRVTAARDLWRLGDANGFVQAMADDAPETRVRVACLALSTDEAPRPSAP